MSDSEVLRRIAADEKLMYEVGRRAVEDVLVEHRDSRISFLFRNNGLVIKNADGTDSPVIRLTTEHAVAIAMRAMADELEKKE